MFVRVFSNHPVSMRTCAGTEKHNSPMLFLLEWACFLPLLFLISLLLVLFYCYVCRAEIFIVFTIRMVSEEYLSHVTMGTCVGPTH